ncbi:MAG: hypothetical protein HY716_12185 [Planctomycetes bacterium]|nr:hypothetical protein [Planctomycetota bacterium]
MNTRTAADDLILRALYAQLDADEETEFTARLKRDRGLARKMIEASCEEALLFEKMSGRPANFAGPRKRLLRYLVFPLLAATILIVWSFAIQRDESPDASRRSEERVAEEKAPPPAPNQKIRALIRGYLHALHVHPGQMRDPSAPEKILNQLIKEGELAEEDLVAVYRENVEYIKAKRLLRLDEALLARIEKEEVIDERVDFTVRVDRKDTGADQVGGEGGCGGGEGGGNGGDGGPTGGSSGSSESGGGGCGSVGLDLLAALGILDGTWWYRHKAR